MARGLAGAGCVGGSPARVGAAPLAMRVPMAQTVLALPPPGQKLVVRPSSTRRSQGGRACPTVRASSLRWLFAFPAVMRSDPSPAAAFPICSLPQLKEKCPKVAPDTTRHSRSAASPAPRSVQRAPRWGTRRGCNDRWCAPLQGSSRSEAGGRVKVPVWGTTAARPQRRSLRTRWCPCRAPLAPRGCQRHRRRAASRAAA